MWAVWRAFYVLVLVAWTMAFTVNYYQSQGDFEALKVAIGATMGQYNWVRLLGLAGAVAGSLLLACIVAAVCIDDGSHAKAASMQVKIIRMFFGLSIELCGLAIVSLSSIYLYVADARVDEVLSGASWVVVLGAAFLAAVVVDRMVFTPALAYIEFMASPCISAMSKNTIMRYGSTYRDKSAYTIYFDRLYPQLPKMSVLHSSAMEIDGVSIFDILNLPVELGIDAKRTVAAGKLVDLLRHKYNLEPVI